MSRVTPDFVEQVAQQVQRFNANKSEMCLVCTEGKLYRPNEPFPHVLYDLSTLREVSPGHLVIEGVCNECGSTSTFDFYKDRY